MKHTAYLLASSTLLALIMASSLGCDVPDKQIGDNDATDGDTDGNSQPTGGDEQCDEQCAWAGRECEVEACCSCVMLGGELLVLESFPPQYVCDGIDPDQWEGASCDWGGCEDQVTVLTELDVPFPPVDATPQDVIDEIGPSVVAPFGWDDDELSLNVPGPMTTVTFEATPNGEVRGVERVWVPPADLPELTGECSSQIEVDVDVTLSTADGALDETFAGVVYANEGYVGDPVQVALVHQIPVDGFEGTLELDPGPGSILEPNVDLAIQLGQLGGADVDGDTGTLSVGMETDGGEFVSFTWVEFGTWAAGG